MKRKTVCIDLDATLAEYDGWQGVEHIGDPIPGSQAFVAAVSEFADVVVFTTRMNTDVNKGYDVNRLGYLIQDWLTSHKFPAVGIWCGQGKPLAAAYVDDRAVICRPMRDDQYDYDRALAEVRALCAGEPLGGQGTYSDGKWDNDEGDLRLQVAHSGNDVRIDFGKPVAWLGFPKDQAIQFAMLILKHAGVQIQCQR